MLLHIYEFVLLHGHLDNFSTFPFENFLNIVKRQSKKTSTLFPYLMNQLMIIRSLNVSNPEKPLFYSSNFLNNCCIVKNKIVLIEKVHSDNSVDGIVMRFVNNIYDSPILSKELNIGFYQKSLEKIFGTPQNKCLIIPKDTEFYICPYC